MSIKRTKFASGINCIYFKFDLKRKSHAASAQSVRVTVGAEIQKRRGREELLRHAPVRAQPGEQWLRAASSRAIV